MSACFAAKNPTLQSPWDPVGLDALEDLLASKVTALLARGLPRDFIDIYEICKKKLSTVEKCWDLWKQRKIKRGGDPPDLRVAIKALRLHLSRIEKMRPLDSIEDTEQRDKAQKLRVWFKNEFINSRDELD